MKRIYFLIITFFVATLGFGATNYDLEILGVQVTSENCGDLSVINGVNGTMSFDPATNTLYMKDVSISYSGTTISSKIIGLTIKAEGKNVIKSNKYAMLLGEGDTNIIGDTLKITGGNTAIGFVYGIDSKLVVDGMAELSADGAIYGIRGNTNTSNTTALEIRNGATFCVRGGTQCVANIKQLILDKSSIKSPSGAQFANNSICNASDTPIASEWVTIEPEKYDLKVAGVLVNGANNSDLSVIDGVSGTVSFDPSTKTLTLKNATIVNKGAAVSDYAYAISSDMPDLKVVVIGDNTLRSTNSGGIRSYGNLTIDGPGTMYINATSAVVMTSPSANTLTINGTNTTLLGNLYDGIISTYSTTTLSINGGLLKSYGKRKALNGVTVPSSYTTATENGYTVIRNPLIGRIYIDGYDWPQDFEPADYEVSSHTPGVKSVSVSYYLSWGGTDKLMDNYEGSTQDNMTIRMTVELEDGYEFASNVDGYIILGDALVEQYMKVTGANAKQKHFQWRYTVPEPEGGPYMRTATAEIPAPVVGEEPVWEISTAAGAKAADGMPEANAKEHFEKTECQVYHIKWLEISDNNQKVMSKGAKFKDGCSYAAFLTVRPIDGMQFHKNTVYKVNGETAANAKNMTDSNVPIGAYSVPYKSTMAGLAYVFTGSSLLLGDANCDGSVTMADANMVVNYFLAADKSTVDGINLAAANVNGDREITMADANMIVNMFLNGTTAGTVSGVSALSAKNIVDVFYGENMHEYVDLGVSVKWAKGNVGKFAWGATSDNGAISSGLEYGNNSGRTVLDPLDDAGTMNWGWRWRMPTFEEWLELMENCYWEWTTYYYGSNSAWNGSGYIVYKAKNEADKGRHRNYGPNSLNPTATYNKATDPHIFLPADGCVVGSNTNLYGTDGFYWTSSFDILEGFGALTVEFYSDYLYDSHSGRSSGFSVRAVLIEE